MALALDYTPQVWGITGNLGGGKTLTAVCLAVNAIKQGYFVCSNVLLNIKELSRLYGDWVSRLYLHFAFDDESFDPAKLPCGSPRGTKNPKRVLVILDEAAEWVDQYTTAQNPKIRAFWSWLRHTSKQNQDVIIIVQRLDYLNKVIRLLISKWVIVDDFATWRMPLLKIRVPFMSGYCMQRVFDRNKKLVQGPCVVKKSFWGQFYDTSQCLNSAVFKSRNEFAGIETDNTLFRAFMAFAFSLIFFIVFSILSKQIKDISTVQDFIQHKLKPELSMDGRLASAPR